MNSFSDLDFAVIWLYFVLIIFVGFYFARKDDESVTNYFLAGRNMGWFVVGASLFATNISSEHFIGLAGSGASSGLIVGHFEWMAVFALIILGWVFAPIFIRTGVYTVPEFLEKRFNKACRFYLASISIVAYITTKISVMLYAGGLLLTELLGWDFYTSVIVMVVFTGMYTIVGGLRSVIYTGVLQTVFLLAGAITLTIFGLQEVGGFQGLQSKLPSDYFSMFRPISDPDFPWTGILFGAPILGIWYWCMDQYIVQRVLAAKNITHAQSATILAGFLKTTPVFLLVIPGMIAVALFPSVNGDNAFVTLVTNLNLPEGVRGLILAGLLAALMSSLSAVFNSAATILTMDFYKHFFPESSERKLVLVGRLSAILVVIAGILWVPLTQMFDTNIYIYMQSVQAYISPPITAVFLFGVLSYRVNGQGAFAALLIGGIIGVLRFMLELYNDMFGIENALIVSITEINFLHFGVFLFLVSSFILISVSALENRKHPKSDNQNNSLFLINLKYGLSLIKNKRVKLNMILSALLVFILLGLWESFL